MSDVLNPDFVFEVEVDVAIARPPSPANTRTLGFKFAWDADDPVGAQLFASQWAASHPGVVMPLGSRVVGMLL